MAKKVNKDEIDLTQDELGPDDELYAQAFGEFADGTAASITDDGENGTSGVVDEINDNGDEGDLSNANGTDGTTGQGDAASAVTQPVVTQPPPEKHNDEWLEKERKYKEQLDALSNENNELKKKKEPAPKEVDPNENLTEDEKKELEGYELEFQEVSKFEGMKRKAALKAVEEVLTNKFQEQIGNLETSLKHIMSFAEEYGREKHLSFIKGKHGDFDDLVESGKVEAWIKTQPKEVREVYQQWYDKGNAAQVVSLFDIYKEKTAQPKPPDVTNQPIVDKNKKKENLTAIQRKTQPVSVTSAAKDDFDGAFDEAANK